MSQSRVPHRASPTEAPDFVLEKSDVTIAQWVRLMQDQVMRAGLISLTVEHEGMERPMPLFSAPLDSFDIKLVDGKPVIRLNASDYIILSAKSRETPWLKFSDNGIYINVPKKENDVVAVEPVAQALTQKASHVRNYFAQSSSVFTLRQPTFTAEALVNAYQETAYKKSISNVTVNHPTHRSISLIGVPEDTYHFEYADQKMMLNIWDQAFEVEAVAHTNGITVIVDKQGLEAYCPNSVLSSINAFEKVSKTSERKEADTLLLQGIIDGDTECFADYMQNNRRKFMKGLMYHGLSNEKAEDVLQDVQLKYIELVTSGKWTFAGTPDKAAAWVESVIRNERSNSFKADSKDKARVRTAPIVSDDGDETDILDLMPDVESDPAVMAGKYDFIAYMHQLELAVEQLPESPLRHILAHASAALQEDGYTQAKYALSQGTTADVMKTLMFRGRELLFTLGLSKNDLKEGTFARDYTAFKCMRQLSFQMSV